MASSMLSLFNEPGINQLRSCATLGLNSAISGVLFCSTNGCMCQDLPAILQAVSSVVDGYCSTNSYDATTVMAAVISYCTVHGYTVPSELASITTSSGNNQTTSLGDASEAIRLPTCAQIPFFDICDSFGCTTNNCICRPDVMASALGSMSSSVSAACSGSAPAGVNSALGVVVDYCRNNGFGVTTFSGEPTGTAGLPSSPSASPGASTHIVQATPSASFGAPSATNSSLGSSPSSKQLDKILPAAIIPAVIILVTAIWLFSRRRKIIPRHDIQMVSPGKSGMAFFGNARHIIAPNSTFQYIGGSQHNQQSDQ